jgi:hypothetical protein
VEFAGIISTIAPEWLVEVKDSYKEDKLAKKVFHKLEARAMNIWTNGKLKEVF